MGASCCKNRIEVVKPLQGEAEAELVWLELGDFHDLSWLFGTQKIKYEGNPKTPGATRTFRSGGVETLLSFEEEARIITWSLNRFPDYVGCISVTAKQVSFSIQAECPEFILKIAERTTSAQLDAILAAAKRRLELSKAVITVNHFPIRDCDAYEKVVQEKEIPALKKLVAEGDLLQFRMELDKEAGRVTAFEVWKTADTQSHHMTESFFKDIMAEVGPTVDVSKLTGNEINSFTIPGPKYLQHMKTVPKVLHRNDESDVFHFRTAMDVGRDNVILYSEMPVKSDKVEACKRLLHEMQVLTRPLSKSHCLQDVRFHLDETTSKLHTLQVFDNSHDFACLLGDAQAPYRAKIDSIAALGDGPSTGLLWGPSCADTPDDTIKAYCSGHGIRLCKEDTVSILSRKVHVMPLPAQVQQFSSEMKDQVHVLLEQLDRYTSTTLDLLPKRVLENVHLLESEPYHIPEPHIAHIKEDRIKVGGIAFRVGIDDDYFGSQTLMDRILFDVLGSALLFPIDDKFIDVPDELVECMQAELLFNRIIRPPNHYYPELSSDAAIERAIMAGVFSLWLKDDPNGHVMVDYRWVADFDPREGFRRLGATAHLNAQGNLTSIYVCDQEAVFRPGEMGWDDAKLMFRNCGALVNTTVDHLTGVHMVATNPVINSAVKTLPCAHTIRRLLQPFSFRSVYVNQRAVKSLLDPHSIVLHACGMNAENFNALLEAGAKKSELWLTPPERMANAGKNVQGLVASKQFPYGEDSTLLYEAIHPFVQEWVDDEYADDRAIAADSALQAFAKDLHSQTREFSFGTPEKFATKGDLSKVIATFIFNATGQHEYVGTVQEYITHPSFMGFRLRHGSNRVDMQAWVLGQLLFCITSLPMPMLMDDFNECWTTEAERKRWTSCKQRLKEVCSSIDAANSGKRPYPFKSFHPSLLECSVNV